MSETVSVRVPFALKKRGGRKLVVTPEGETVPARPSRPPLPDNTLVKALARAHRWRKLLEEGHYATVRELAEAERINQAYLGRVLRLTLLAPDVVEAIIEGRQGEVTLAALLESVPAEWDRQKATFRL